MDRSLNSTEKALQAVNSHLLDRTAWTAAGTIVWVFLNALKVNMNSALHDAMQVHDVQTLGGTRAVYIDIKQEVHRLEEPSVSDSEVIRNSHDEVMRLRNVTRQWVPTF